MPGKENRMAEIELTSCPFCGGDASLFSSHRKDFEESQDGVKEKYVESFIVRCDECGAMGSHANARRMAVSLWNHRASKSGGGH